MITCYHLLILIIPTVMTGYPTHKCSFAAENPNIRTLDALNMTLKWVEDKSDP